ncbi:MAG: tolC 2, partial [Firmicutes bacterium]|nr:tolC 2 [Bacillota bacterium]
DMVSDQASQEWDSILLSVRQYYLSMAEAEKRIGTNKVSVNQAEENLMIQKARYEVGVGTNLDLRDAVLALDSAQKDYIQALYDYHTSKAKLEQAMGLPVQ